MDKVLDVLTQQELGEQTQPDGRRLAAVEVFLGYLLLDAWIGNQDRHHENWGILLPSEPGSSAAPEFAPSYDHASCLGQNLRDEERTRRLTVHDSGHVTNWVRKARGALYADEANKKPLFGLPSFDLVEEVYRYFFFVRGIRHEPGAEERIRDLAKGDALVLLGEPDNEADPQAILVREGSQERLGYVPKTLVEDIHDLVSQESRIEVTVEQVNRAPAPVQLRLLCRLEASAAEGFLPFAGERYQPIAAGAARIEIRPQELVG